MFHLRGPEVPTVSARQAYDLVNEENAVIVDVREMDEWRAGHIPGAVHIPLHELRQRAGEIPQDRPVVLQCRSGNRSGSACAALLGGGWKNVHNLAGGIMAWHGAGLPVEQGA